MTEFRRPRSAHSESSQSMAWEAWQGRVSFQAPARMHLLGLGQRLLTKEKMPPQSDHPLGDSELPEASTRAGPMQGDPRPVASTRILGHSEIPGYAGTCSVCPRNPVQNAGVLAKAVASSALSEPCWIRWTAFVQGLG